ncbi:MAG: DNA mismatch endonuclease Vsr [Acidobacteriota bacterium]
MADIFSKDKRSQIMSKISGKETKPEILVRKFLFAAGFRYRKNDKRLPGKPDIILPKYQTAIFVHGCFWHHHKNCKFAALPQTNNEFWKNKIEGNANRDNLARRQLKKLGWQVIVIWQCQLKNKSLFSKCMNQLITRIKSQPVKLG